MKKIITLLVLGILFLTSCDKAYYPPLENYYQLDKPTKKWVFNQSSFGLEVHRPNSSTYWERCEKMTINTNDGYIVFNKTEFRYLTNKDTIRLYEHYSDVDPDTLKYVLIYDRSQVNFPGIFIKQ